MEKKPRYSRRFLFRLAVIVAVLVALTVVLLVWQRRARARLSAMEESSYPTETISTRDLVRSIGATGTIVSPSSRTVAGELSGTQIAEIYVEVGDTVRAGDPLLVFDTENIERNLAHAEEVLETSRQLGSLSATERSRSVQDAQRGYDSTMASAADAVEDAKRSWDDAQKYLDEIRAEADRLYGVYSSCVSTYEHLRELREAYDAAIASGMIPDPAPDTDPGEATEPGEESAQPSGEATVPDTASGEPSEGDTQLPDAADPDTDPDTDSVIRPTGGTELIAVTDEELAAAQDARDTAWQVYVNYANAQIPPAESAAESAQRAYERTVRSYGYTDASAQSSLAAARSAQISGALSSSTYSEEQAVEAYQEQMDHGIVYAPMDGLVTAVNYEPGDTYPAAQTPIFTIQDVSAFEIETQISEYDISDVSTGQRVLIKTNATGDEELEGTVLKVSPVSTASALGTSAGSVTYTVRISVDTPSDRLRLDMSASLSIILEEHTNAMTVPYNAVQTDTDGDTYVEVVGEGSDELRTVYVEVRMESNYYTEIASDELSDEMQVRLVETESSLDIWDLMY